MENKKSLLILIGGIVLVILVLGLTYFIQEKPVSIPERPPPIPEKPSSITEIEKEEL